MAEKRKKRNIQVQFKARAINNPFINGISINNFDIILHRI